MQEYTTRSEATTQHAAAKLPVGIGRITISPKSVVVYSIRSERGPLAANLGLDNICKSTLQEVTPPHSMLLHTLYKASSFKLAAKLSLRSVQNLYWYSIRSEPEPLAANPRLDNIYKSMLQEVSLLHSMLRRNYRLV